MYVQRIRQLWGETHDAKRRSAVDARTGTGMQRGGKVHLLEGLVSMALYEVTITLLHAPIDVSMQNPLLVHTEVVLLAVECIKQVVLPSSDVPLSLQPTCCFFTLLTAGRVNIKLGIRHAGQHVCNPQVMATFTLHCILF